MEEPLKLWTAGLVLVVLLAANRSDCAAEDNATRRRAEQEGAADGGRWRRRLSKTNEPSAAAQQWAANFRRRLENFHGTISEHRKRRECSRRDRAEFQFYCPSPDVRDGKRFYKCIDQRMLCDRVVDCPGAEDEDFAACMFYEAIRYELYFLRRTIEKNFSDLLLGQ